MLNEGIMLGQRYEIISRIGTGGMADVYKGKDTMLNRFVAIKVLKREFREDEMFVKKFRVEAQSAAGLMHPNVVNVYDVGEEHGLYYMVMELVEGITLKEYIQKKGKLSAKEVISITIQIANGIDAAHRKHIIHRDIKPQNVIISKEGKVKVTDFGIAKATTSNTISSNAMGSVHYTSPEQARGGFSDAKSDVYSTGITMYEMVTGEVPFDGDSTVSIAIKHLQEEIIPPSELVHNIPYSLEQIILKCTQKSADRRYQDMTELILDLKRSLVDPEGDFVGIAPFIKNTQTIAISQDELDEIQRRNDYDDEEYDEEYDDEYDDDEYDDDEYDEEYDTAYKNDGKKSKKRGKDEVDPKMKKVTKILMVVAVVIIAFILIFIGGKAAGIFKFGPSIPAIESDGNTIKVPDLVGLTEVQATDSLKKKGLKIKVVTREESPEYEAGVVTSQKTAAGKKVKKNATVEVVVSSGLKGAEIDVPDVTNQTEDEATRILKDAKLKSNVTYDYSDSVAEGNVITTTPAAGSKVAKDTVINVVVSKGAQKAKVPNIVGMSQEDAIQTLGAAGLVAGNVDQVFDSSAAGTVLSQGLRSGKEVINGTAVDFTISKGPETKKVTVPSLVGKSKDAAVQALSNAKLYPDVSEAYSSDVTAGYVISASIASGAQVEEGTTVSIVISKGPETAPEPKPEEVE